MKFRKNGDRMEIKIRNVDPVVVTKLDELARKQHLSRNEYLKKIVSRCAVVQDVVENNRGSEMTPKIKKQNYSRGSFLTP